MLGRKILPLVLAVAPVGCGATRSESSGLGAGDGGSGGASEGGSPDAGRDGPFVEARHLAFPQEVWQGGAVLTAPKVVSVTFPGDSMASALDEFGQSVASSKWWDSVRAGYCAGKAGPCVGDGPAGVSAQLTTAPAAAYTDAQLQAWLEGEITTHALPAPDSAPVTQTIYVLYFPQSTTITDSTGTGSCSGFDGYHGSMTMGSQQVVYAVVNECPQYAVTDSTLSASHEIIEAATDPSNLVTAYYLDTSSPDTWGWDDVLGGEVADMCVDQLGLGQDGTSDGTFTAQRAWSNSQAAGGGDPCAPVPSGGVYFNVSPQQEVFVLDVGGSVTFETDAFSTAAMSDWTLSPQDWTSSTSTYLSFSIEGGTDGGAGPIVTVNNGSKAKIAK